MLDIGKLHEEIRNSEALKIDFRLQTLEVNHYVVQRNFQELMRMLEATQNPDAFLELWIPAKRRELGIAMTEVTRLLLNFITSAATRARNTSRILRRHYKNTPFLTEYNNEVTKRFEGNNITGFVEDLRNYSYHYRLPLAGGQWELTSDANAQNLIPNQKFILQKSKLLEDNWKWNKGSGFLASIDEEIVIQHFVERYFQEIQDFHRWTINKLKSKHRAELEWLYASNKKIQDALSKTRNNLDNK